MIYPFMTLNDNTEIVHSEMNSEGKVKVMIETPDEKLGVDLTCEPVSKKQKPLIG